VVWVRCIRSRSRMQNMEFMSLWWVVDIFSDMCSMSEGYELASCCWSSWLDDLSRLSEKGAGAQLG
jgi:hypothetical protein